MIDNLSLLVTTVIILFIIFRAAKLDKALPWFDLAVPESPKPETKTGKSSHIQGTTSTEVHSEPTYVRSSHPHSG
jgi:hypothetical protein